MKYFWFFLLSILVLACNENRIAHNHSFAKDSLILVQMVHDRVQAMQQKDLPKVMIQFSEDATYINSAGVYCKNKKEIKLFHSTMFNNDSLTYNYKAGKIYARMFSAEFAVVYYTWLILWNSAYELEKPVTETGLMTLTAKKSDGSWKWIAITNQHTPEFIDDLYKNKEQ